MKHCLYCQTENDEQAENCKHCGMNLPTKHPQDKKSKLSFFVKAFWLIVIFSLIMVIYLPR